MDNLQKDKKIVNKKIKVYLPNAEKNPTWEVGEKEKVDLMKIWNGMRSENLGEIKLHSDIFYSGCQFNSEDGSEWFAYKGVTIMRKGNITEIRRDENRRFEKKLLKTAPRNLIPDILYITEFSSYNRYRKLKTG